VVHSLRHPGGSPPWVRAAARQALARWAFGGRRHVFEKRGRCGCPAERL